MDDAELGFEESWLGAGGDDLTDAVCDFVDCCGDHFEDVWFGEDAAAAEMVDEGPFDEGDGSEDCVVEEFVDDVDCVAWVVGPVFHDGGYDLAAGCAGLRADGEESVFAAFDAGEEMGEGFGADTADGCHVGVGGWDQGILNSMGLCLLLNGCKDSCDLFFCCFLPDKLQNLLPLLSIRGSYSSQHHLESSEIDSNLLSCEYLKSGVSFSFASEIKG